jgi:uncharacterized protein Yka (UPF0111/DUF47 family)
VRLLAGGIPAGKNFSEGGIKVIDLILKRLNTVEECLTTAVETVETYLKGAIPKAKILALKVDGIETQTDFVRYNIRDTLYSGSLFAHDPRGYLQCGRED